MGKQVVVVEVRGGLAEFTVVSPGIEVVMIDFDAGDAGECPYCGEEVMWYTPERVFIEHELDMHSGCLAKYRKLRDE